MKRHHHHSLGEPLSRTLVLTRQPAGPNTHRQTDRQTDKQKKHPQKSTIIIGKRLNQKHQKKKDNHQHTLQQPTPLSSFSILLLINCTFSFCVVQSIPETKKQASIRSNTWRRVYTPNTQTQNPLSLVSSFSIRVLSRSSIVQRTLIFFSYPHLRTQATTNVRGNTNWNGVRLIV